MNTTAQMIRGYALNIVRECEKKEPKWSVIRAYAGGILKELRMIDK